MLTARITVKTLKCCGLIMTKNVTMAYNKVKGL